ncbi:uncharacterized protein N7500_000886 [Penicillium coprophilum]|uniref:uncharacterized protein n=1 Tax=Penicillium coprophilum TaxID=36646 RepID=UPI00239C8D0A|nr:uncharacterized protein N7500_000886 [Penicillium coprophilum]KAJ5178187.1 hypothetical protein N7500_000886 [Penicillium coprophilum]
MRIRGSIVENLPLSVGQNKITVKAQGDIPRWIGDILEREKPLGRLGLGAGRPLALRANRRLECEEEDNEAITTKEKYGVRRESEKEI